MAKAAVCKTVILRFESGCRLQKKRPERLISQAFLFNVLRGAVENYCTRRSLMSLAIVLKMAFNSPEVGAMKVKLSPLERLLR